MQIPRRAHLGRPNRWPETVHGTNSLRVPALYHDRDAKPVAEDSLIERDDFFIRLATTRGHRREASMLIHRLYSWRGYEWNSGGELVHGPNQMTFQACGPRSVFGTLSLRLDSDAGLLADELYGGEVDAYRRRGGSVCELVWFAVDREYGSREVLACLFQLIYIYSRRVHGMSDIFIEVNPRHVAFYEQRLDFTRAGDTRVCERVGAPAVLLHLDLLHVDKVLALDNAKRGKDSRSLYRYFLSPDEQDGLCRRILDLPPSPAASHTSSRPFLS
jgi:N-acyl amino acid synthase FeeM